MDGWTRFDVAALQAAMPTDLTALYTAWVEANPAKANRRAEIVAEVLARFRATVETYPGVTMDPDPDTVPTSGFRHALNLAIFTLGMEMGVEFAPEVSGPVNRADVWLRMVASGAVRPVEPDGGGSPHYAGRDPEARVIWA